MTDSAAARPAPRRGSSDRTAALLPAAALGTVIVLDVLRVWMPSVIFVYGDAGSTPAEQMGRFALGWVVAGLVAAALVRVVSPTVAVLGATAALAAARLGLQLQHGGGDVQLLTASLGWVAAMAFLGALAAGMTARRVVAAGVAVGLVGDAALRAATRSVELTWVRGGAGTLAGVALVAAFVVAVARARPALVSDRGEARAPGGPAWPWLAVGPVLVLYGVLAGTPARVTASADVLPTAAAMLVVAALGLGASWALAAPGLTRGRGGGLAAAALVLAGTIAAMPARGWLAVGGHVALAVGLGGSLGVLGGAEGTSTPSRRSLAAASSLALLFVVGFLYYAAYDFALGVDNGVVLVGTAVVVTGLVAASSGRAVPASPLASGRPLALGLAVAVLLAGAGTAIGGRSGAVAGDGLPVRVMLYNVHMGFDTAGRFDTDALADVIAEQGADVVVMNEADRGWFLNGSHDVLQLVADELGMTYVFAPAADEIWGNAILSRLPLVETRQAPLPSGGAPMARSWISAVIDVGAGERLAVVGTHLHHVDGDGDIRLPQAEAVAAEAERLAGDGLPVVVMGDMNAEPGEPELQPYLDAGLEDAVTPNVEGEVLTFPSWGPREHIDHVFTTPDLVASDVALTDRLASDHRGIAVTIDRR